MANEKRLIDANLVKSSVQEVMAENSSEELFIKVAKLICQMLDHAPTVDAVEVVRCKDCKHREDGVCHLEPVYDFPWYYTNNDDFCSYGERREGE